MFNTNANADNVTDKIMSNNKQSSVEWLVEQFESCKVFSIKDVLEQAKAMHKEEIIRSYKNAMASAYFNTHNWMPQEGYIHKAEQYYNETFNTEEK